MTIREFLLENLAGDLEYHPRRAVLYFCLAVAAANVWIFWPAEFKLTTTPAVFGLGALAFAGKGIFLFRKSSEGLGLTHQELAALAESAEHKRLPSIPSQAAQILQDFGVGGLLLWPLLGLAWDFDHSWGVPSRGPVILVGAILFALGWLVRRFTSQATSSNP